MTTHELRQRLDDGEIRFFRAIRHGAHWRFASRPKSDPEWQPLDPVSLEDLRVLRENLFCKYQRGRIGWEIVLEIEALIEDGEGEDTQLQESKKV